MSDPDFAKELVLTESQRNQILGVHKQRHREIVKSIKTTGKSINEKLLELLTKEQKAVFEKLKGKPFQ